MIKYAIVHMASGAIITVATKALDELPTGLIIVELLEDVDPQQMWWNGETFQPRALAAISVGKEYVSPGDTLAIDKPEGAWVSDTAGAMFSVSSAPVLSEYRINSFNLIGAFRGSTSVKVCNADPNMVEVRAERDRLLTATDKYTVSDYPQDEDDRLAWLSYRRTLRELPEVQSGATMATVVWPTPPSEIV